MARAISLPIILAALIGLSACAPQVVPKLVRIKLGKTTSMQAGDLGQPVTSYYVNVGVGTPAKPFKLLVDIGAREIWLPHYLKLGLIYQRLNYANGYLGKDSNTSVKATPDTKYTFEHTQCQLTGKAYRDYVEFRNVTESLLPVRFVQRFLAISSASNDRFTRYNVDGVLALNPFPISESGTDLPTVGLSRADLISELKIGLLLNGKPDDQQGGELSFGAEDRTKYLGALRYHQGTAQHEWRLNLHSVMFGGNVVSCLDGHCNAIVSTSLNDIYGPAKAIKMILKDLGVIKSDDEYIENHLYEIDCLRVASAPPITFIIDGAYYTINALTYIKKKVDGLIFKSSTCYVSILSNGSQKDWILGTNFVSNYYTVLDVNQRRVAFGVRV